jgi:hypothetical protein
LSDATGSFFYLQKVVVKMKTCENDSEWRGEFRATVDCSRAFMKDFALS